MEGLQVNGLMNCVVLIMLLARVDERWVVYSYKEYYEDQGRE